MRKEENTNDNIMINKMRYLHYIKGTDQSFNISTTEQTSFSDHLFVTKRLINLDISKVLLFCIENQ